ncbi:MAG: nicotinamide-nucleotide adenylyltransferase [Halobacteriales archaeon]
MRGFFVGRFQPFHGGHRRFVEQIAAAAGEVVVAIGSAQASHERADPFTAGERVSMVHRTLAPLSTTTFAIPVEDIDRYAVWVAHVEATCPPFDVVYSNNPLVRRLFREAGYEIRGVELYERDRYSGTEIRRRMVEDERWQHLVPDPVVSVVEAVDGVARLRRVSRRADV